MSAQTITIDEGVTIMVDGGYPPGMFTPQWSHWLNRGDVILIFTNQDLSHPEVGHVITMPWYGDLEEHPLPPHAPDHPAIGLGWRYTLTHTITKESAS